MGNIKFPVGHPVHHTLTVHFKTKYQDYNDLLHFKTVLNNEYHELRNVLFVNTCINIIIMMA